MDGSRRLFRDQRGVSATIGVALIIALTIIGAVVTLAFGSIALSDTQQRSEMGAAEHAMTQLDSRTSQVALGDSEVQSIDFGGVRGSYSVDPSSGTVKIIHRNFDGDTTDDGDDAPGGDDELLYEATMGAVVYDNGDSSLAYEGGGVWRKDGDESTMVSPPEFHYRDSTLTFPIIRVNQDSGAVVSAAGSPRILVEEAGPTVEKFPVETDGYPDTDGDSDGYVDASDHGDDDGDGDGGAYINPQEDGEIIAVIQSDYYKGWAQYFRSRTEGTVTVDHSTNTVTVELLSTGFTGRFDMPGDGGHIDVRGIDDHSMSDYSITIVDDQSDNADMNNLQWSMWVGDGDRQFEMHLRKSGGSGCNVDVSMTIYYSPSDGDADADDPYHGWKDDDAFTTVCKDTDGDGTDEIVLEVDFVDDEDGDNDVEEIESGDTMLEYQTLSSSDVIHWGNPNNNVLLDSGTSPTGTFDGHDPPATWEPRTYDAGDTESVDRVVNHYFSELGPGFELTVDDKNSNTVEESLSEGNIQYTGGSQFITYLHVSENDVEVSFG